MLIVGVIMEMRRKLEDTTCDSCDSGNNSASRIKAEERERKQRSQEDDTAEEKKDLLLPQNWIVSVIFAIP